MPAETQVLIVGAGPVGLTLALDLGQRGVRCVLIEGNETSIQLPKMERCNGRTMEIFRRLGIAEAVRDAGLPRDAPMDVFLTPPLLRSFVERQPTVSVRFGCELTTFSQAADGVQARVRFVDGTEDTIGATYVVGCDGGSSTRAAMAGRLSWRAAYRPNLREDTPEGAATRAEMGHLFDIEQRKVTEILGIEGGYCYVDSPIICPEPGERPNPDSRRYVPTTWPGARLPHVWLDDGTALAAVATGRTRHQSNGGNPTQT